MLAILASETYSFARTAIAAIDAVMLLPSLPSIPVRMVSTLKTGGEGAYIRQRGGLPLRIEIAEKAEYPELTLLHEMAHYLDDCGFGEAEGWASEVSPRLEALRLTWENTDAVRALRTGLKTGQLKVILPNGLFAEFPLTSEEIQNCRYYLQGRELFARSYVQYIAAKSKNRVLLHQVSLRRESVEGRFYQVQWVDSDFPMVAEAYDRVLEEFGWLR